MKDESKNACQKRQNEPLWNAKFNQTAEKIDTFYQTLKIF